MISKARLNAIAWFVLLLAAAIDFFFIKEFYLTGGAFAALVLIVLGLWVADKLLFTFSGKRILR